MAQAAALYGLLLLLTVPVAVSYAVNHARLSGWGAVGTTIAVLAGYTAVRWIVPVALARPPAACIRPGRYSPWAATYLRLWALDVLVLRMSPPPWAPICGSWARASALASPIATSFVGLPTLLRVDRDAAIGYGATLRPWQVADGWVTVAPITIGERAYVGANAVCEPGACPDPGPGPWTAPGAPVGSRRRPV